MRKLILIFLTTVLAVSVSEATTPVTYYPFTNDVSASAIPTGWVSLTPGVGEHSRIDSGSLSYPGFPESLGNSWGLGQGTADYEVTITNITGLTTGDKVYYSFLMRLNSPLDAFNSGNFRLYNSVSPTGSGLIAGWGTSDFTQNKMGFSLSNRNRNWSSAVGVDNQKTPETYTAADTVYLIIAGYHRGATYQESTVHLWVNPDSASFNTDTPPAATLSLPSY